MKTWWKDLGHQCEKSEVGRPLMQIGFFWQRRQPEPMPDLEKVLGEKIPRYGLGIDLNSFPNGYEMG
jgi:hypothetical protein